jgi:uncharacterized protein
MTMDGEKVEGLTGESRGYPDLYIQFLYYFNILRDYYECHEVLEELWLEEGRDPLWQGLLQIAVGLYHFRNENINGARKLLRAALDKLEPYPARCAGIHLGRLKQDARELFIRLERFEEAPVRYQDLDIIVLEPELQQRVEALKQEKEGQDDAGR